MPLTDISSMKDLDAKLPECPDSPNCIRVAVEVPGDSAHVTKSVNDALLQLNAFSIDQDTSSNQIEAVFRIPVFGWKDDVIAIVERGDSPEHSVLYLRSASRVGYYDLGVNKRRVKKIVRKLNSIISK